jgi:hypothetical protein
MRHLWFRSIGLLIPALLACRRTVEVTPHSEPARTPEGTQATESPNSSTPVTLSIGALFWIKASLSELMGPNTCSVTVPENDNIVYLEWCDWKDEDTVRRVAQSPGGPLLARERLAAGKLIFFQESMRGWVREIRLAVHDMHGHAMTTAWARVANAAFSPCPDKSYPKFTALDVPLTWATKTAAGLLFPEPDWNAVGISQAWRCR